MGYVGDMQEIGKSIKDMTNSYVDVMHVLYIPMHYPIYLQLGSEAMSNTLHQMARVLQSVKPAEW